jgi:hypothetical protein
MVGKLAPGDVVTVTRIDRLARNTFDLFGIVNRIVDAKAQFRSLAEPWADTRTSTGRLMVAVLGALADVERDLTRTRTAEGRSRAKAQGKHMGRRLLLSNTSTAERGHQTPRTGRYVAGIGRQLRPQHIHHAPRHARPINIACRGSQRPPANPRAHGVKPKPQLCSTVLTLQSRPSNAYDDQRKDHR